VDQRVERDRAVRRLLAVPRAASRLVPDRADRFVVIALLVGLSVFLGATVAVVRSTPGVSAQGASDAPSLAGSAAMPSTPSTPPATAPAAVIPPAEAPSSAAGRLTWASPGVSGRVNLGGDQHPNMPAQPTGTIEIPKIGLVHPTFEGVEEPEIHWGPGHWPGTARPGQPGNTVFAGHRVTHTRPFYDIDLLTPGDEIILRTSDGAFTYKVTGHQIVTPKALWIVNQTPNATITIFACTPKGSARQRYVVQGELVSSSAS
jgi:sortase A